MATPAPAFPTLANLDDKHVVSEPVRVADFQAWCERETHPDALVSAQPELAAQHRQLRRVEVDLSIDDLACEAPQDVLRRRVAEEAAALCVDYCLDPAELPEVTEFESTGVQLSSTMLEDLPVNHGLPLEGCGLQCVQLAMRERIEHKRRGSNADALQTPAPAGSAADPAPAASADPRAVAAELGADEPILRAVFYSSRRPIRLREVLVTGSQTLGELRDALVCENDSLFAEVSAQRAEGTCAPSAASVFFIGGRFFTDDGAPSGAGAEGGAGRAAAVDYSAPLRAWLACTDTQGVYPAASQPPRPMRETRISELEIQLGAQCLFRHRGACEHVLVFAELCRRAADDESAAGAYPRVVYEARGRPETCFVCKQHTAKVLTVGSESYLGRFGVENPSAFCDVCYHKLHYSASDGRLLYHDFKRYKARPVFTGAS